MNPVELAFGLILDLTPVLTLPYINTRIFKYLRVISRIF